MKTTILQPHNVLDSISTAISKKSFAHAYLISGAAGAGKQYVAYVMAAELLDVDPDKLESSSLVTIVDGSEKPIGIEDVRKLQQQLRLKTVGRSEVRRVVLVLNSQTMTIEGQNALLKTLEEPPEDTKIILTTTNESSLRPTILSRVQKIRLQPISSEESTIHFLSKGYDKKTILDAHRLSQGAVGLMTAILEQKGEHQLLKSLIEAKQLLSQTTYERLLQVETLSKDKEKVTAVLNACKLVLHAGLRQSISSNKSHDRWKRMLNDVQLAIDALQQNANSKIVLTNLFVNL